MGNIWKWIRSKKRSHVLATAVILSPIWLPLMFLALIPALLYAMSDSFFTDVLEWPEESPKEEV